VVTAAVLLGRSDSSAHTADVHPAEAAAGHATTTTTTKPATPGGLVQPPSAVLPAIPPGSSLGPGSSGPVVVAYQHRLIQLHFDPGPVDGKYGGEMAYAVQAVQKIIGAPRTGAIGPTEAWALEHFRYPTPLAPNAEPNRTEIDITKQVITLYQGGQVRLITTTSTGAGELYCYTTPRDHPTQRVCEYANTPSGRFTYTRFVKGWDKSPLGQLYNPFYFNGGIAIHGYDSVPPEPASHGCARIPMHIAEYFHTLVHVGDPVYVFGGKPANVVSSTRIATNTPAPPPAAPGGAPPAPHAKPKPKPKPPTTTRPPVSTPPTTKPVVPTT
jgi:peptidoglycan hydrolase-like protein with peptidoglycan-binding domain